MVNPSACDASVDRSRNIIFEGFDLFLCIDFGLNDLSFRKQRQTVVLMLSHALQGFMNRNYFMSGI